MTFDGFVKLQAPNRLPLIVISAFSNSEGSKEAEFCRIIGNDTCITRVGLSATSSGDLDGVL